MSRPFKRSKEEQERWDKKISDQWQVEIRRARIQSEKSKSGCVLVLLFFSSLLTFAIILAI